MEKIQSLLDSLVAGASLDSEEVAGALETARSTIGNTLSQATGGLRDAADGALDATKLDDLFERIELPAQTSEIAQKARDLVEENRAAAGAVVGGLGLLLLGSKGGRKLTATAAKAGGLALIGGLAYRALQNHREGKPVIDLATDPDQAEDGSPALPDHAVLYVRAMVAAACADRQITEAEKGLILQAMRERGMDHDVADLIDAEFSDPASSETLAEVAKDADLAAEIYTAARITIEPDTEAEETFLQDLAGALAIDDDLLAHLDAAAIATKGSA